MNRANLPCGRHCGLSWSIVLVETSSLDPAIAELLKGYPIVVTTMVGWGDMDANRHVNNVMYFRYIEHARLKYFDELGFSKMQQETGIGPILSWTDCRFRRPLSYPDDVSIGARISDVGEDRFVMHTIIVSHVQKQVAAEGQQRIVVYDYWNNQKAPLPEVIRKRIEEFEGTDSGG
jgi:acyl-CoA thioester hydrolase